MSQTKWIDLFNLTLLDLMDDGEFSDISETKFIIFGVNENEEKYSRAKTDSEQLVHKKSDEANAMLRKMDFLNYHSGWLKIKVSLTNNMQKHSLLKRYLFPFSLISFAHFSQAQPLTPPAKYEFGTTPIWQDEFNDSGKPDAAKWSYDLGGNGWGNHELENYTDKPENARVEKGSLIIEARKEKSGTQHYSSARLVTKGKGDFLYGKFEIRAKLPKGRGSWPAIWMLFSEKNYGNKGWPDNGEIDIMEHVGFDQNHVHGNIHTKAFNHVLNTNKGGDTLLNDVSENFHVYTCAWTPDYVSIGMDGSEYFRFDKEPGYSWEQWPFDKPLHVILNLAVGGDWGGQKGVDDSIFPQKMEVDYVRVYPWLEKK